jgi:uncharacterized membrane protein YfcA
MNLHPQDDSDLLKEEHLEFSRNSMFTALDLFFKHTQYSIALLVSMLAAVFAVLSFSIQHFHDNSERWLIVCALGSAMLCTMFPISLLLRRIVSRYFRLYVSCYVYAARLHLRVATISHPWFDELKSKIPDINSSTVVDDYLGCGSTKKISDAINAPTNTTNWFYRHLISFIGGFGSILGILGFIYLWCLIRK